MKKQIVVLVIILISLTIGLSGCSETKNQDNKTPSETMGVTDMFSVNSTGKVIATSDGKVTLDVPANALINQTNITISSIQGAKVENYTVVSAYQHGPEGTCFLTPATLTITYNPETLPSGLNQSNLRLFTLVTAGFGQVANSSVDTTNHIVTGQISHFSRVYVASPKSKSEPKNFPIVGKWDRTDGADKYTFRNGGSTQTIINGNPYYGRWDQDNSNPNKYTLTWDFGPSNPTKGNFVDYITIAADSKTYEGVNNYGNSIHCVRVDDDQAPVATIKLPPPPNKVENTYTLYSTSYDPDDPVAMLKYTWVVTSPKGEVVSTSTPGEKQTTFMPHLIGDYVVTLKVDDGVKSDLAAVIFTLEPNVIVEPHYFRHSSYYPNSAEIEFTVKNNGIEPLYIVPIVSFTGTWGAYELGPTRIYEYSSDVYGADTPGYSYAGGAVHFDLPAMGLETASWNITGMKWNAILTAYNGQTTYYSDPPWVKTTVEPYEAATFLYPESHTIEIGGPPTGPIIEFIGYGSSP